MALGKEDLIKKGIEGLNTPRGKEIFKFYFLNEMSQEDIRDELHKRKRVRDLQVLYNLISNYTLAWEELGYIIGKQVPNPKSKSKFHPNKTVYRATINPFFDYAKQILSSLSVEEKIKMDQITIPKKLEKKFKRPKLTKEELEEYNETEFNDIEKKILTYIFSFKRVRKIIYKNENFFEGVTHFLERIFFYKTNNDWPHRISHFFREGFFIKDKSYVKVTQESYTDRLKEIKEFEKISFRYFIRLRNKIKLISNFSDQDYFDLTVHTSLRKYQYMPTLKEITEEKDRTKKIGLVNLWSKIYFFDEIPKGW